MSYRLAVVGATGNVGRVLLDILSERDFPVEKLHALGSERSVGKSVSFGETETVPLEFLDTFDFSQIDLVFFCASDALAQKHIPRIQATSKAYIIDKSSAFRMDPHVPLMVPEINAGTLSWAAKRRLIANPNCVVVPLALSLQTLAHDNPVKKVVVSTYQSVSGAGKEAMDELYLQTKATYVAESLTPEVFPKPIAFNVIPQIDRIEHDGFTGEEHKIMGELKKIIHPSLQVTPTCVRVPVFNGHAASVHATFEKPLPLTTARERFKAEKSIQLYDSASKELYATPVDIAGEDAVYISRLRQDPKTPNELTFWLACDNLRKGAALNAVQIAELLVRQNLLKNS